jgi:hypothetical protein
LTIGNERVHQDSNDNGVTAANFATKTSWLFSVECSCTEIFINTPGPLLMGRLTIRFITYRWISDGRQVHSMYDLSRELTVN